MRNKSVKAQTLKRKIIRSSGLLLIALFAVAYVVLLIFNIYFETQQYKSSRQAYEDWCVQEITGRLSAMDKAVSILRVDDGILEMFQRNVYGLDYADSAEKIADTKMLREKAQQICTALELESIVFFIPYGEVSPTGKLTMSFPRATGQCPIIYNEFNTGRPRCPDVIENQHYISAYIDCLNAPLYPFGYGLTYTEFVYSTPVIEKTEVKRGESLTVSVTVKNLGKKAGETTAQLYIRDEFASCVRPKKELKDYRKVYLEPNEEKTVSFTITEETLKFWTAKNVFAAENGSFVAWIADSSQVKDGVKFYLVD